MLSWRRILQCGLKNVSTQDETPKTLKDKSPLPCPNHKTKKIWNLISKFGSSTKMVYRNTNIHRVLFEFLYLGSN